MRLQDPLRMRCEEPVTALLPIGFDVLRWLLGRKFLEGFSRSVQDMQSNAPELQRQ